MVGKTDYNIRQPGLGLRNIRSGGNELKTRIIFPRSPLTLRQLMMKSRVRGNNEGTAKRPLASQWVPGVKTKGEKIEFEVEKVGQKPKSRKGFQLSSLSARD